MTIGIIRIAFIFEVSQTISMMILLFWIIRNLYFLILSVFLVDGRDSDGETVIVADAEPVMLTSGDHSFEGVTTRMTEHNLTVFLDDASDLDIGHYATVKVDTGKHSAKLKGVVTGVNVSRRKTACTYTVEILDFGEDKYEYWQILYDRIPTLPQSLTRDFGIISHLWQNIAHRVARTRIL